MIFKLETIESYNDTFSMDGRSEIARILRNIADKVENHETTGTVRDLNGNKVSYFTCDELNIEGSN